MVVKSTLESSSDSALPASSGRPLSNSTPSSHSCLLMSVHVRDTTTPAAQFSAFYCIPKMAASGQARRLDEQDLYEWMLQLGASLRPEEQAGMFSSQLRDGVALCHLVNRLRPGSVEDVSETHPRRVVVVARKLFVLSRAAS